MNYIKPRVSCASLLQSCLVSVCVKKAHKRGHLRKGCLSVKQHKQVKKKKTQYCHYSDQSTWWRLYILYSHGICLMNLSNQVQKPLVCTQQYNKCVGFKGLCCRNCTYFQPLEMLTDKNLLRMNRTMFWHVFLWLCCQCNIYLAPCQ